MAAINDDDDDTKLLLNKDTTSNKPKQKKPKKKKTFRQWLFSKPLSKLPFLYFVVGMLAVPALAIFHFMDADIAYIICGGFFITLNIFGFRHFYLLIGLKKEVDQFGGLNKKFGAEHGKLTIEVNRISAANQTLRNVHNRIQSANAKNRENLSQFAEIQETMKKLNLENVSELQKVVDKANGIGNSWQKQLLEHERDMLHTVFDRFELQIGKAGMTKQEFALFSAELPESYQKRFARLGIFEKISHDGKHLKFSDFNAALDLFAEMDALDCDIEFSIETTGAKVEDQYLPESTLEVIPSSEDWGDISDMKRWTTRRKKYDDVEREIVVHARHFVSGKARSFTSSLGFNVMDDAKSDVEEEEMDAGYFEHDRKTSTGLGRMEKSVSTELMMAGRMAMDSEDAPLIDSTDDK